MLSPSPVAVVAPTKSIVPFPALTKVAVALSVALALAEPIPILVAEASASASTESGAAGSVAALTESDSFPLFDLLPACAEA